MTEKEIDQVLVLRVKNGDDVAFNLLVSKYHRKVIRLVGRLISDPFEAEDIAQDVFIKVYRALPNFRGESAFYTWLYRIAINTAKNSLNAKLKGPKFTDTTNSEEDSTLSNEDLFHDNNTPESILMSKQIAEKIQYAMSALSEDLRMALTLREIDGLSYDEIATIMSCPIGTVRSRISRAREMVAVHVKPHLYKQ